MKDLRRAVCAHGVYIREMSCKCLLPLAEQHFNALPQRTKDTLLTSQFKDSVFCLYSEMSFARLFHAENTSISIACTHTHTHCLTLKHTHTHTHTCSLSNIDPLSNTRTNTYTHTHTPTTHTKHR